jgi:hypothetical protein
MRRLCNGERSPDGRFFVNNVPVKQGANTITMAVNAFNANATANTTQPPALEQSYTVNSTALQPILVPLASARLIYRYLDRPM